MEPVKVDIRKLQLLNDRIAQVLDALNQVRLSAHGLGATTAAPFVGAGIAGAFGAPYGTIGQAPGVPAANAAPGLGHTTGNVWGMPQAQFTGPFAPLPLQTQAPWAAAYNPLSQAALAGLVNPGLAHSTANLWGIAQNPYQVQNPLAAACGVYGQPQPIPAMVPGLGHTSGLPQSPFQIQNPLAAVYGAYGQPQIVPQLTVTPGLAHTTGTMQSPFAPQTVFGIQSPISPTTGAFVPQVPGVGINPYAAVAPVGLAHTSPEALDPTGVARQMMAQVQAQAQAQQAADPYLGLRISHTFPFAQWTYSPFASTV